MDYGHHGWWALLPALGNGENLADVSEPPNPLLVLWDPEIHDPISFIQFYLKNMLFLIETWINWWKMNLRN